MATTTTPGMFIGFPDPLDDPGSRSPQGYEIQIDPTDEAVRKTGAIYSFQGANPAQLALAIKPHGQWNVMEVAVDGKLIVCASTASRSTATHLRTRSATRAPATSGSRTTEPGRT